MMNEKLHHPLPEKKWLRVVVRGHVILLFKSTLSVNDPAALAQLTLICIQEGCHEHSLGAGNSQGWHN